MMNTFVLVVPRFLHVAGGALWDGAVVFFRFFLQPAIKGFGPESQKFGQTLNRNNRFSQFMGAITLLNVLSGFVLFYLVSGGLIWDWGTSGSGIGFTLGALAGIGALFIGGFSMRNTSMQLRAASEQLAAQSDSPALDLANRTASLQKTLHFYVTLDFWLLAAAMLLLPTARYWNF